MKADSEDFASKNKLRLLRICETLCPREVAPELGITMNVLLCVDPLLFFILGDGRKPRVTLKELCDSSSSQISAVQRRILDRLEAWGMEGPDWALYTRLGGSPHDRRLALLAKRDLLRLGASTLDHFELRMSQPPYTLIALADPAIPDAKRRCIATSFLNEPLHCLSLFCRRLRDLCPDESTLMGKGAQLVDAWAKGSYVAIDMSERSHAQLRQKIRSDKGARAFVPAANRLVCSQLRDTHIALGGRDPALLDVSSHDEAGGDEGAAPHAQQEPGSGRPSASGLNPYLVYRNHRFHTHKQTLTRGAKMKREEMQALEQKCKADWARMSPHEQGPWQRIFRGKVVGRGLQLGCIAPSDAREVGYRSWCGTSVQRQPIPLAQLSDYVAQDSCAARRKRAARDAVVVRCVTPRASLMPAGTEVQRLMWGCVGDKKTCRAVLPAAQASRVDDVASLLREWASSLGAEVAGLGQSLICLRGASPESGERMDIVLLLVMERLRPSKLEFFARCCWRDCEDPFAVLPDNFPFTVSLRIVPSRMSRDTACVDFVTNEEVAKLLPVSQMAWKLHPLVWEVPDERQLLDHKVTAVGGRLGETPHC